MPATVLDNQPTNVNLLAPQKFNFIVKKLPHVNFWLQQVNIPSIKINPTAHPTPFVKIPYSGDQVQYEPLNITFKLDEDMENYMELHNWLRGLAFPESFSEHAELVAEGEQPGGGEGIFSDISLMILTNLSNPNIEITFRDAFPVSLSEIRFDTTSDDIKFLDGAASFRYTLFDVKTLP